MQAPQSHVAFWASPLLPPTIAHNADRIDWQLAIDDPRAASTARTQAGHPDCDNVKRLFKQLRINEF